MNEQSNTETEMRSATSAQGTNPVVVESLASEDRPMQQMAPTAKIKKKHRAAPIIGAIAALVVLIGGAIAVALIMRSVNNSNPVASAIAKIANGGLPENAAIDGDIDIAIDTPDSMITNIKISLQSGLRVRSLINSTTTTITASLRNFDDVTFKIEEIYASGDDLFIKIEGVADAITSSGILSALKIANILPEIIDCGEDEQCQTEGTDTAQCAEEEDCESADVVNVAKDSTTSQSILDSDTATLFAAIIDELEIVDDEWIRVPLDELSKLAGGVLGETSVVCTLNLISSLNTSGNTVAEYYSKYPFITSSSKDVAISSRQHPAYKLGVDTKNFADFADSIRSTALSEQMYSCLNLENDTQLDENDMTNIVGDLPNIYVEVDDDNNFSRLYAEFTIDDGVVKADLNFTYPSSVRIPEPLEYQDYSDIIKDISTSIYEIGATEVEVDN